MGNALRIFKRDLKRLLKAPAAMVVVIALLVLPSLYTWYNVIAFWNPYDATGNMRVCVVNQDAGATTDMTGELNVGDKLIEELSANEQLAWAVEDYDTAMGELRAGDTFAVFVIPEDFSICLVSPLTGEIKQPRIQYFANEKLGPVSPKITDTAASTLDQTINSTFVATVAEAAVNAVDGAVGKAEGGTASAKQAVDLRTNAAKVAIDNVRDDLANLEGTIEDAHTKTTAASNAVEDSATIFKDARIVLQDIEDTAQALKTSLEAAYDEVAPTLSGVPSRVEEATEEASGIAGDLAEIAGKAKTNIELATARVQPVVDAARDVSDAVTKIAEDFPIAGSIKNRLTKSAKNLSDRVDETQNTVDGLNALAEKLGGVSDTATDAAASLSKLARTAPENLTSLAHELHGVSASSVESGIAQIKAVSEGLFATIDSLETAAGQARGFIGQLDGLLDDCAKAVSQTNGLIGDVKGDFDALSIDAGIMGQSDLFSNISSGGAPNAQKISEFMGAPTEVSTTKLYPLNAYGAAMAPLFMNLTFWIGAFMLVIIFRLEVDSESFAELKPGQRYLGRFFLFAIFAALQAAICCAGTLALGVEASNALALFGASIVTSLAYLSIIYALSSMFGHVGKALCIVLVFAQIPGGSGLYPLELTSSFFQGIYPLLPFTYGIDAMREAIGGFYGSHFAYDLIILAIFFFGNLIVGLLVGPLMSNLARMTARQVREGDLYNGEEVSTPERPYRLTQVLRALTDKDEYRREITARYERFSRRYPILIRAAIIVGVGIPVLIGLLFALDAAEKVTLITFFLLWLVALIGFLVIVESRRYSLERQLNMDHMSSDRLLNLFAERNRMIRSSLRVTQRVKAKVGSAVAEEADEEAESENEAEPGIGSDEAAAEAHASRHDRQTPKERQRGGGLRNIGLIIRRDASGLVKNVMSVVITVGLIVLPSLFAWYNILACWNVFDNTGNLSVAVASQDAGYTSELLPLDVNIGDKVVSALHENDQINWVFTNADDAIEGTKAGTYYAALVIPEDFSKQMLTFADGDAASASIDYYVNEKKNAIAPNITGMGADTVSYEVNAAFAKTLSEVAVGVAQSLSKVADSTDLGGFAATLTGDMRDLAGRLDQSADALGLYSLLAKDAQGLLQGSSTALESASAKIQAGSAKITNGKQQLSNLLSSLSGDIEKIESALDSAKETAGELAKKAKELIEGVEPDTEGAAASLREKAADLDERSKALGKVKGTLEKLRDDLNDGITKQISIGDPDKEITIRPGVDVSYGLTVEGMVMVEDTVVLDKAISVLSKAIDILDEASAACTKTAAAIEKGTTGAKEKIESFKQLAEQVRGDMEAAKTRFDSDLAPYIDKLKADVAILSADLDQGLAKLSPLGSDLPGAASSAAAGLGDVGAKIDGAGSKLQTASQRLVNLANAIDKALASGDTELLNRILRGDAADLAAALTEPVQIERTAIFPCENFGSAMAPLYCTLAIFIGSLLIMVAMKPEVSRRGREQLSNPKPRHLYFGRFGAVATISLAQTTLLGLGCMLFLKVQVADPLLYMLCFWISGLVLAFIIYTLVVAFGNLGKAIAVLLLIVQVTGCGGSYPLQILPDFVQAVSPWLPATYIVDALRAAMMGIYMNDFWIAIGHLALFVIPFLLLGLVLRKPLERFMKFYVSKVEDCKIME